MKTLVLLKLLGGKFIKSIQLLICSIILLLVGASLLWCANRPEDIIVKNTIGGPAIFIALGLFALTSGGTLIYLWVKYDMAHCLVIFRSALAWSRVPEPIRSYLIKINSAYERAMGIANAHYYLSVKNPEHYETDQMVVDITITLQEGIKARMRIYTPLKNGNAQSHFIPEIVITERSGIQNVGIARMILNNINLRFEGWQIVVAKP